MAVLSGIGGSAAIGAVADLLFRAWSIDYNQDAIETTNYGSSGARDFVPGLTSWSGSAEGFVDGATAPALDTTLVSATFSDATDGVTWSGSIVVTGMSFSPSVDGVPSATMTFQGSGALAIA